jgi:DNA-binding CsgD family transcriptional regulator
MKNFMSLLKIEIKHLNSKEILLIIILFIIALGNILDLVEDFNQETIGLFFIVQIITIFLSIGGLYLLIIMLIHSYQEMRTLNCKVEKTEELLQQSRIKLKKVAEEYHTQLQEQFSLWGLTPKEQEIALLLLKGLSAKEIASIRYRSERTVRHQASAIYRKSGVAGRHEFSAWFFVGNVN